MTSCDMSSHAILDRNLSLSQEMFFGDLQVVIGEGVSAAGRRVPPAATGTHRTDECQGNPLTSDADLLARVLDDFIRLVARLYSDAMILTHEDNTEGAVLQHARKLSFAIANRQSA